MHHVLFPVLQLQFKFVDIVVQLADLLIKLCHQALLNTNAHLSHQLVQLALVADSQLDLVLHFTLQLGDHLLQLSIDLHWLLCTRLLMGHTCYRHLQMF